MEIIVSRVSGVCVVSLKGDFISEVDQELFRQKIHSLAEEGNLHVVIELAGVKYINSCGLGSLVCALTTLRKIGGDLRLVDVGAHVRELFAITQLNKIFEIYPSLEKALPEFSAQMN